MVALLPHGLDLILAELVDAATTFDEACVLRLMLPQVAGRNQPEQPLVKIAIALALTAGTRRSSWRRCR